MSFQTEEKNSENKNQSYIKYLENLLRQNKIAYIREDQFLNIDKKERQLQNENFKNKISKNKVQSQNLDKLYDLQEKKNQVFGLQQSTQKLKSNIRPQLQGKLVERYCRQMLLKQFSYEGQLKIIKTKVAVIGCGGIGCPLALYLAGAGVGTLGIFDSDSVDITNLHRQIGHKTASVGIKKTASLKQTLLAFNPNIFIKQHQFVSVENCQQLLQYDLIIDGSDNPKCRYIVNDYCMKLGKKLLSGACIGWEGQVTCYGGENSPCYRCIWGNQQKTTGGCSTLGVVGMLPGFVGIILAIEALKLIINEVSSLQGHLLTYQSKSCTFRKMKLRNKVKQCIGCGVQKLNMNSYDYLRYEVCGTNVKNIPEVEEISWNVFLKNYKQKRILDVRPKNQFNITHLQQMINIPYDQLTQLTQEPLKDVLQQNNLLFQNTQKQLIIFISCNRGVMSKKAANFLSSFGYKSISITGGITEYSKKIDDSIPQL